MGSQSVKFITVFESRAAVFWVTGLRSAKRLKSCVEHRGYDGVEIGVRAGVWGLKGWSLREGF